MRLPRRVFYFAGAGTLALIGLLTPNIVMANTTVHDTFAGRLTIDQYQAIITETFGADIKIGGRLNSAPRIDGLIEVGSSRVSASPSEMEQYYVIARSIADQVTDERHRDALIQCKPKKPDAADETCARQFLTQAGSMLFRRPLTAEEVRAHVAAAGAAANQVKDFYKGLSLALAALLSEPQFLFRDDRFVVTTPGGKDELDPFSKASRLSFFLWNSAPDEQLFAAAEKGELDSRKGLLRQVERMTASPRIEGGIRAFFSDMLRFDELTGLTKDPAIYPKFAPQVADAAREQTLRTIVDVVLTRREDYRNIFTTKRTFLTRNLAAIYRVPLEIDVPNGSPDTWMPYEFPASDPRAGILMEVSFVAANAHPGRSSPTLRGKALREVMLCEKVPPPPGNVKFDIVQDTSNPIYKTARDRLNAHHSNPVCAGCHKLIDPIGLALENFDGAGDYRTTENGVPIDTSGELDGIKFSNGAELGMAVHDNPAATSCVVDRLAAYALGRSPSKSEASWIEALKEQFAQEGYVIPDLMRQIAASPEFYGVNLPNDKTKLTRLTAGRVSSEGQK